MVYHIKCRKVLTRRSDIAVSLLRKGYQLQSVSFIVNGNGTQNYTLIRYTL